ncbi:MAG: type I DNA topoisomerase [Bdellovibrionales bacterium]|nr:type I DNA topoisomerase [Bdellovibrionales bacterium]
MAAKSLVIVESPTKAKTIRKFLPKNFVVEASMGHVRDLPQSAADVPQKYKKEAWARIGVNIEQNFEPLYVVVKGKAKVISSLKDKLKGVDELYLATDEDREGESISWHLIELLRPKVPVKRMVFHEITKGAIQESLQHCREIDKRLVQAQETRRILDRLVGYTLSPLIWKKIAFGLSAGRVQSAGLRLIVQRERERLEFKKASYWDLKAEVEKDGKKFEARLVGVGEKKVATGKDFDEKTGQLLKASDVLLVDEAKANGLVEAVKSTPWQVTKVEEKMVTARPSPPFITSTLQQEANRKLNLSARDTMRVAQTLYEQGLITYMRTDSPNLSKEALVGSRKAVEQLFGKEFLSDEPRQFTAKSKSAQEAHEAIRPAGEDFVIPAESGLTGKERALYELIWKRTVASQMAETKKLSMSIRLQAGESVFAASGMKIAFPGFLRAYVEGSDSPDAELEQREVILPELNEGDTVKPVSVEALSHETKPPARFTEASLVQRLEKEGIGRPSTYASIIGTIQERGYVKRQGNALSPTFTGMAVVQLLERHFSELVDYSFTSEMERSLDEIAQGDREWLPYLKNFYLGDKGLLEQVQKKEKKIDPDESRQVDLLDLKDISLRVGRFGAYLVKEGNGGDPVRASIPEDLAPADLTEEMLQEILEASEKGPQSLGKDPETGKDIFCLLGRYGPYVQLGEMIPDGPKPKRASVPKGTDYRQLTLPQALKLLSLPRELGKHPDTGEMIVANNGRFGPYVVHQRDFRSLKKTDDVYTVDLKRALEILAEPKRGRGGAKLIREVGVHPDTEKGIYLYEGKYGVYIKYRSKNIGLPKDTKHETLTLEQALELIEGGSKAKGGKPDNMVKKTVKAKRAAKKKKKTAAAAASDPSTEVESQS